MLSRSQFSVKMLPVRIAIVRSIPSRPPVLRAPVFRVRPRQEGRARCVPRCACRSRPRRPDASDRLRCSVTAFVHADEILLIAAVDERDAATMPPTHAAVAAASSSSSFQVSSPRPPSSPCSRNRNAASYRMPAAAAAGHEAPSATPPPAARASPQTPMPPDVACVFRNSCDFAEGCARQMRHRSISRRRRHALSAAMLFAAERDVAAFRRRRAVCLHLLVFARDENAAGQRGSAPIRRVPRTPRKVEVRRKSV